MEEQKIHQINKITDSGKYLENKKMILGFLGDREARYYFLCKLPKKFDDLREIRFLLEELVKDERPFELFNILKKSISEKNNLFIIEFLQKYYEQLTEKLREEVFQGRFLMIVQEILKKYPKTVDGVYSLVKRVLALRQNEYKKLETKRSYSREKELISELLEKIFTIYRAQKEAEKLKNIITLIDKHFNLIGDDGRSVMYTPNNIFKILKYYIDIDFKNHFKETINLIIEQYSQEWKRYDKEIAYKGWEEMGGGISQFADQFSIRDRHFISYTLQPALNKYYEKDKGRAWKFIIDNCINRTIEEVSKEKPDFLNRSALGILFKEYESGQYKEEAFEILSDFIKMRKGIPFKADLVFQALKGSKISDKDKWALIKVSLNAYDQLPINIFVEHITTDLVLENHRKATKAILKWVKNPEYIKRQSRRGRFYLIGNVAKLLGQELTVDFSITLLKNYLSSDAFKNDLDRFDAFKVGRQIARVIQNKPDKGLSILSDIYEDHAFTVNQQIAITGSIEDIEDSNIEMLIKVYNEFLLPILNNLEKDITTIEKKFSYKQARENIVQFANKLAKAKRIKEALDIVRIFVNDSDPCTPEKVDPQDPEGKYDEHKKIEQGEDTRAITTVRGWCAWVLTNCPVLSGRDYIEEIIDLTEKLTQDKNYYVQWRSCYPLSQLARNRLAVMPENKEELFFNKDKEKALNMAKRVENIAFNFLERISELDQKPKDVLMKALLRVFYRMRSLNQNDASKFIKAVANCGEEVIAEAVPLFIYFTEFRAKNFKARKWQIPGLYDDLEDFDSKEFKQILKEAMLRTSKTKSASAWHFRKLVKESVPDKTDIKNAVKYSEAFKISNQYLNILADSYDHQTFNNIYYFIQENISERFEECYKLWRKCLEKEKPVIKKLVKEEKVYEASWWPFDHNGEILMIVKEKGSNKEFLDSFEFLLDYPKEANIGDMGNVLEALQSLPSEYNERTEKIFDKLIDRNPNYYDTKEAWNKKPKNIEE